MTNFKKNKEDLLFVPLGGSGEIGMNMNLYHLDGKWLMVDFGAGFADDYLPGIDMIVPDISFIYERRADLEGLVLTHAHEDHLGAIIYLWHEFKCPIYATPFTAAFLREKIAENPGTKMPNIIEVATGSKFKVGVFDLEMVQITHSVPEMNAVVLRTRYGNIFHTGDWKFDPTPMVGPVSDKEKLAKYGNEGVLALVGDSTNVFSSGHSKSEGDLRESLIKLVSSCNEAVFVTTFASNVARIESIIKAAEVNGRKVIISGRSLWRIVKAAQSSGYLQDCPQLYEADAISKFKRNQILVISTGCQGEPMATVSKIAHGSHKNIVARPGDTIIFSSKIIPGNEKRLFRVFNKFVKLGVEIMTERDHFVHVSGHPNVDELEEMYKLVKPAYSVPVHGEDAHMHEHVRLAKEWGVKNAFQMENGVVLRLAPGEPQKLAVVEAGYFGVDGKFLLPPDSKILKMRRRAIRDGVVNVSLVFDKDGLVCKPVMFAPGFLDETEDAEIFDEMAGEVANVIEDSLKSSAKQKSDENIKNITRMAVRRIIRPISGKNPAVEVLISRI